jgi:RNA recognition motif-containing protein
MNKKLYVGNLSGEVTEQDLNENFSTMGKVVSAVVIKDRYTNQSKGFGFVEMETEEAARQAIAEFNGGELEGRKITVSEAREQRKDRDGGFGRGSRPGSGPSRNFGGGGRRY